MRGYCRALAAGLIGALAMLAIIIGLGAPDLTARSAALPSVQTVNRTLKGDRLPLAPAFHPNTVNRPFETSVPRESASNSRLPDGCEPLVSPFSSFELARIAGRCVS